VAEQLTCVVPVANRLPEAEEQSTGTLPSTSSVAVAVKLTVAPDALVATSVMSTGRSSIGAVVSSMLPQSASTSPALALLVRLVGLLPSAFIMNMSFVPARVLLNAIFWPSGDQLGSRSLV
jgi:hypothetical protein